jgi:hypothetical protein
MNEFSALFPSFVPVTVSRGRDSWKLVYVEPCFQCGEFHRHGGGPVNEPLNPDLGSRVVDCPSDHKPFRPDCRVARSMYRCAIRHMPAFRSVELHLVDGPEAAP